MANIIVEKRFLGGLDTDTNLQGVEQLDYIDAVNCQNIEKQENNHSFDVFPLGGNEYKFELPDVELQKKGYRIYVRLGQDPLSLPSGAICDIELFTQNGVSIGTINLNTTNSPNLAQMAIVIVAQAAAFTPTFALSATATVLTGNPIYYGYVDVFFEQFFTADLPEDYSINITGNVPYNFATLQESLAKDVTGEQSVIGRFNVENDLFLWATTVRKVEFGDMIVNSETNITTTAENANVEIVTVNPHRLFTGQQVIIPFPSVYAGIWLVVVVDDFTIQLVNSAYTAYVSDITVLKKYVSGYGSILYANRGKDFNWYQSGTTNTVATRLIGAKSLNFSTLKQIDGLVKVNNFQAKFKFTDNFNPYRLMIYKGSYVTDGFLYDPITDSGGIYTYDNLDEKSRLVIGDTDIRIDSVTEVVGAGVLTSKNYVFFARLVNDDFTRTPFSFPSNPYSLFPQDTSDVSATNIFGYQGSVSAEATNKALDVVITNIPESTYKYLEVAIIEYRLGSPLGYISNKIELSQGQSTVTYRLENALGLQRLDLLEINKLYLIVKKGLNIVDMDNRSVISNITLGVDPDLTDWAQSIPLTVNRKSLLKKETLSGTNPMQFGEYELPQNILNFTGYHLEDTVRCGIRLKLKGAQWTKTYFIGDINIKQGLIDASIPYDMTDGTDTFSYFVEATNVNWDFLIGGVRLRDIVEDAIFVRAEVNSEVIASGLLVIGEPDFPIDSEPRYDGTTAPSISANRKIGFFYSADTNIKDAELIPFQAGDILISLGQPVLENTFAVTWGEIAEFNGKLSNAFSTHEIVDLINYHEAGVAFTQSFPLNPSISVDLEDAGLGLLVVRWVKPYVFLLDTDVNNVTANTDLGVYNVIWKRPKGNLYPTTVSETIYQPIWGVQIDVANDTTSTVYEIFGGDTFTMKRYLKMRLDGGINNASLAFGFYSQSKRNTQLARFIFPQYTSSVAITTASVAALYYLQQSTLPDSDTTVYDISYSILNTLSSFASFNPNITEQESSIATIYWSLQALEDTEQNNDRYFLPLNFRAIDATAGAIMHMVKANDILYTFQKLRTERQYFDNTQMLQSVTGTEILLGTGAVMSVKGDFKSTYGCQNKWSVQLGTTQGGRQYIWYVDAVNKKIVRIGDDGTKVISDIAKIFTWAFRGLKFAGNQLTPSDNYGLHAGWDEKNSQLYITSRTFREIDGEWDIYQTYEVGNLVTNGYFYGLNDAPLIYQAIQAGAATIDNEPGTGEDWEDFWQIIPYDESNYNFWTIVWSETENRFKWFISPRPKIWIGYKETILSPSPVDEQNIFEHTELGLEAHWYCRDMGYEITGVVDGNTIDTNGESFRILEDGFYRLLEDGVSRRLLEGSGSNPLPNETIWGDTIWYLVDSNGVQYQIISVIDGIITVIGDLPPDETEFSVTTCVFEEPYIENVVNENQGRKVRFVATKYNSIKAPKRVEYKTNQHISYLNSAEFEDLDQYYSSPVKVDTTNSPNDNETDASELFGKYLRVKTFLGANNSQKINSFVMKIREMNPLINK
jgi:hypothetical protein